MLAVISQPFPLMGRALRLVCFEALEVVSQVEIALSHIYLPFRERPMAEATPHTVLMSILAPSPDWHLEARVEGKEMMACGLG